MVIGLSLWQDESKKRKLIYKQLNCELLRPMTADEAANIPATGLSETERLEIVRLLASRKAIGTSAPMATPMQLAGVGERCKGPSVPNVKSKLEE